MIQKVPLSELPYFVRTVLAVISTKPQKQTATLIALRGDLGAGKTTFTQALARELGITATVQSPTYILMRKYQIPQNSDVANRLTVGQLHYTHLVHIDAYRLNNAEEFEALKPEQFLNDPKVLVVIEWPEKVEDALPEPDITINFSSHDATEGERYIEVV